MATVEIQVRTGNHKGQRFTMQPPGGYVGRGPHCTVSLREPSISNTHLRFTTPDGETWWIEDMRSTNGSALNDERVAGAPRQLPGRGVIKCANVELEYRIEADVATVAAPVVDRNTPPPTLVASRKKALETDRAALDAELDAELRNFEQERRKSPVTRADIPVAPVAGAAGGPAPSSVPVPGVEGAIEARRPAVPTMPDVQVWADPEGDLELDLEPGEATRVAGDVEASAAGRAGTASGRPPAGAPIPFEVPPDAVQAGAPGPSGRFTTPEAKPFEVPETIIGRLPQAVRRTLTEPPPEGTGSPAVVPDTGSGGTTPAGGTAAPARPEALEALQPQHDALRQELEQLRQQVRTLEEDNDELEQDNRNFQASQRTLKQENVALYEALGREQAVRAQLEHQLRIQLEAAAARPQGMEGPPADAGLAGAGNAGQALLAVRGLLDQSLVFTREFGEQLELLARVLAVGDVARSRQQLDRVSVALADLHLLLMEGRRMSGPSGDR